MNFLRKNSQEHNLFVWNEITDGILFSIPLSPKTNLSIDDYVAYIPEKAFAMQAQWLLLKELLDNGQAQIQPNGIIVPHGEICSIVARNEQHLLGLPELFPFDIEIRSHGTLNESGFRYLYRYLTADSKELYPKRTGCVLRLTDEMAYLLTHEQVALLDTIDEFNARLDDNKDYPSNLIEFAKIKSLAVNTGTTLDRYLNNENVAVPSKIRLRLQKSGELVEIAPDIPEIDNNQFQSLFDKFPNVEKIYSMQKSDGTRTRVVFQEKQREALQTIKNHRRISKKQLEEIANEPQAYFDPEVVDLDGSDDVLSFSERVFEIGIYHPRIYPFVSSYKSQWIPGALVESPIGERTYIKIKNSEELDELKQQIVTAKQLNQNSITWGNQNIPVGELEKLIPFFEKKLNKPNEIVDSDTETPVLIIEENVDKLGYVKVQREITSETQLFTQNPVGLKRGVKLFPHQLEGFIWLRDLYSKGLSGALLADDMGIGKTLQVLCFMEWLRVIANNHFPYLIVAPVTLLENWNSEYNRFFENNSLRFTILHGIRLNQFKEKCLQDSRSVLPDVPGIEYLAGIRARRGRLCLQKLSSSDVILTTYETIRDFQLDMGLITWGVVVVDEAQKIKTPGTLVTNALKALKAKFRIACTGTPVENSLVDLWCITDFVAPGHLGSAKEFAREFQTPLKDEESDIKKLGEKARDKIGVLFKRRLKTDILKDLPEKHIHIDDCRRQMPEEQINRYIESIQDIRKDAGLSGVEYRNYILRVLNQIKDICDHPLLIDSQFSQIPVDKIIMQSAKLQATIEILKQIQAANEKVIIFAERRKTQHLLKYVIGNVFGLKDISIINGEVPGSSQSANTMKMTRQQIIDIFQAKDGFNLIIMSPLAAGVGMNITEANHVIHYSRWWNPAKEDQASDRVYRIGQKRPVHIYIPMSICDKFKTFDIILHELLEKKRQLSQGALFPTERMELSPEELVKALQTEIPKEKKELSLGINEVDLFDPTYFKAFIAALFEKQGNKIKLTPLSGNKGADVIVFSQDRLQGNLIVHAKHCSMEEKIGSDEIIEILAGKGFYENQYNCIFNPAVVTNREFTKEAKRFASLNNVQLNDRNWLQKCLGKLTLTRADVRNMELSRGR